MSKFPPITKDEKRAFYLAKKRKELCENPIKGKWRTKFDDLEKAFEELMDDCGFTNDIKELWRLKAGLKNDFTGLKKQFNNHK